MNTIPRPILLGKTLGRFEIVKIKSCDEIGGKPGVKFSCGKGVKDVDGVIHIE